MKKEKVNDVKALIESGNGYACYDYLLNIEDRDDVRQAMIDSGYIHNQTIGDWK